MVSLFEGTLKIANLFLSVIAGYIGISLIRVSNSKKDLKPWIFLIVGLVFFALTEVFGALRAFGHYESPYITHIIPTIILALVIVALVKQILICGGK